MIVAICLLIVIIYMVRLNIKIRKEERKLSKFARLRKKIKIENEIRLW